MTDVQRGHPGLTHASHNSLRFNFIPPAIRTNAYTNCSGSWEACRPIRGDTLSSSRPAAYRELRCRCFAGSSRRSRANQRRPSRQTNDHLLTLMLYDCAAGVESQEDPLRRRVHHASHGRQHRLRRITDADKKNIFTHTTEPVGEWVIEAAGEVVATGGVLSTTTDIRRHLHEVAALAQRRGYGAYLVQGLKRTAYEMVRVSAARSRVERGVSRGAPEGGLPAMRANASRLDCGGAARVRRGAEAHFDRDVAATRRAVCELA